MKHIYPCSSFCSRPALSLKGVDKLISETDKILELAAEAATLNVNKVAGNFS